MSLSLSDMNRLERIEKSLTDRDYDRIREESDRLEQNYPNPLANLMREFQPDSRTKQAADLLTESYLDFQEKIDDMWGEIITARVTKEYCLELLYQSEYSEVA